MHKGESSLAISDWNIGATFGMKSYLQDSTWPEISMAIHQGECIYKSLYFRYESAIRHIAKHKGVGIKCHLNEDVLRGWVQIYATDTENVVSHSEYISFWK